MNNRSHELAAETQVTALLPASTFNTNAWMLTLLWTSIQADKQRVREIERKWPLRGLDDPQSLLQSFDPPVQYCIILLFQQKGTKRSNEVQSIPGTWTVCFRSVNPVNKWQQQTEQRINVSKKEHLRGVIHHSCDCWNVPAISTSSAAVW